MTKFKKCYRYENYDYPPTASKPSINHYPNHYMNGNNISYRNLPLPRYHLDPVLENGLATDSNKGCKLMGVVDSSTYARHYSGHDLMRYHEDRDRHNDSGYSTRPGESSQGHSPSLSGFELAN